MDYKYKKYKNKYKKLKNMIGGFTLSNICAAELGVLPDDDDLLYQNVIKILKSDKVFNYNNIDYTLIDDDDKPVEECVSLYHIYNFILILIKLKQYNTILLNETYKDQHELIKPELNKFIVHLKEFLPLIPLSELLHESEKGNDTIIKQLSEYIDKLQKHKNRELLLKYLYDNYIKDSVSDKNRYLYNVQYAFLIYLLFFLEIELFIITYSSHSYNYFMSKPYNYGYEINETDKTIKQDNIYFLNKFERKWECNPPDVLITKPIYNTLFDNDILIILKTYICKIEKLYKDYIDKLYEKISIADKPIDPTVVDPTVDNGTYIGGTFNNGTVIDATSDNGNFYDTIFSNSISDYRHLNYNKINNEKYKQIIIEEIQELSTAINFNTDQIGLFDYVFKLDNTGSCITYSIIEFYITSRLHILDTQLVTQSASNHVRNYILSALSQKLKSTSVSTIVPSHWASIFCDIDHRIDDDMIICGIFNIYNKQGIYINFLATIYLNYDFYLVQYPYIATNPNILNQLYILYNYIINIINLYNENYIYFINYILQEQDYTLLSFIPFEYQNKNKELIKQIISSDGLALQFASDELRNDEEVVLEAVIKDGLALQFASGELRNNIKVVLEAVKKDGLALQFASDELRNDEEVVLEAVIKDGLALQFASGELRNNIKVVLEAVKKDGLALQFASDELRNDEEVVLEAVKKDGLALQFASDELRNNRKVILEAVKKDDLALQFAI